MTRPTLTKTRLINGLWQGVITGATTRPEIEVRHLDQPVPGVTVTETTPPGSWALTVPVPPEAIADGVQSFVIRDSASDTTLGHFTLIAGDAAADDLRAELDLVRAELDSLKRAFRQHCRDTS